MDNLSLKEIQEAFSHMIYQKDQEKKFIASIEPGGTLSREEAIGVYQRAYKARFTEALGETFESVWWVVGDSQFFELAEGYIYSHASHVYNLSSYGAEFPQFLEKNKLTQTYPFLSDLATFEWSFKELFHTEDTQGIDAEGLAQMAEDGSLIFRFKKAFHLFSSPYDVFTIWGQRKNKNKEHAHINWKEKTSLMIYKYQKEMHIKKLKEYEYALLTLLYLGTPLAGALQRVSQEFHSLSPQNISDFFAFLFHARVIESIDK